MESKPVWHERSKKGAQRTTRQRSTQDDQKDAVKCRIGCGARALTGGPSFYGPTRLHLPLSLSLSLQIICFLAYGPNLVGHPHDTA